MPRSPASPALALLLLCAACSDPSPAPRFYPYPPYTEPPAPTPAAVVVAVGANVLAPASGQAPAAPPFDFLAHYELTTPADTPFGFDLVTWQGLATNFPAMVSVVHVRDGEQSPVQDGLSLARAGMLLLGSDLRSDDGLSFARGDGIARLTIQGRITQDQLLAIGNTAIGIRIGPASAINRAPPAATVPTGVASSGTLYSSDSWQFGLPSVATAGTRTSVVCYEGDLEFVAPTRRYALRLQQHTSSHIVLGGATLDGPDGVKYGRGYGIFARDNVLGVVRSGEQGARMSISFDRGATFTQELQLLGFRQTRHVHAAIGPGHALVVTAWRTPIGGGGELAMAMAQPTAFGAAGEPQWFTFQPDEVVYSTTRNVVPLPPDVAWSSRGDLAIAYGADVFSTVAPWTCTSEVRCAVRPLGGQTIDREVDHQAVVASRPAVAIADRGPGFRILYAYETPAGVRIATSDDAGATFAPNELVGSPGDHTPAIFAADVDGETRIDVLYLAPREQGLELHRSRWLDFSAGAPGDDALTSARLEVTPYAGQPALSLPPIPFGIRVTQVQGSGYDAVRDGDRIVVAYDEVTWHSAMVCYRMAMEAPAGPAVPPLLAPAFTEPMPAPSAAHAHQLKLLRLQ